VDPLPNDSRPAPPPSPDAETLSQPPPAPQVPPSSQSEGRFDAGESRASPLPAARTIDQVREQATAETRRLHAQPAFRVRGYELLDVIGRGGMGTVYKVRHLQLGRVEALKMITSDRLVVPILRRRFLAEMQTLCRLEHDHIVKIYHAGETEDQELYFSMAFEASGDLAELIARQGRQDPRWAASVILQVARAVEFAHGQQVIHCDIKPHNIVLSADGKPRVTDFGLALLLAKGEDDRPAAGDPIGTPSYMPPEQARGQVELIQPWSDVYGLGAVLYELLTGRPPFQGETQRETLAQVVHEPPRPPRELNPQVPRRLQAICLKCLQKEPKKRYATAAHLARALDGFLRPWWRRRWVESAVAATFLVLAGALLWVGWDAYQSPRREAQESVEKAEQARRSGERNEARHVYAAAEAQYEKLVKSRWRPDRAEMRLALARVKTRLGELREEARDPEGAEQELQSALALMDGLRQADPDRLEYVLQLAEVYHHLGVHAGNRSKSRDGWKEAKTNYETELKLIEGLGNSLGDDPAYRRDLARAYGYLGDAQLALGEMGPAWDSYTKAEKLREALAAENPADTEAACLRARDFYNRANWHDWQGELEKAIRCHRDRLDYYRKAGLGERLPGDFRTERADTAVTIAELELDSPKDPPPGDIPELLKKARQEYLMLLGGKPVDKAHVRLQAGLARIHVAWAEYCWRMNNTTRTRQELVEAEKLFRILADKGQAQPDDYYRWTVAAALRGELEEGNARIEWYTQAGLRLRRAVKVGWQHREQLRRERAFVGLRKVPTEAFNEARQELGVR
jgi:tetratricopeptide (TPR) repeat protein/tRNA A-37 threonylcarbamoyl transferase component Bud32